MSIIPHFPADANQPGFTTKITGNLEFRGKKYDRLTMGEAAVSRDRKGEEQVGLGS